MCSWNRNGEKIEKGKGIFSFIVNINVKQTQGFANIVRGIIEKETRKIGQSLNVNEDDFKTVCLVSFETHSHFLSLILIIIDKNLLSVITYSNSFIL